MYFLWMEHLVLSVPCTLLPLFLFFSFAFSVIFCPSSFSESKQLPFFPRNFPSSQAFCFHNNEDHLPSCFFLGKGLKSALNSWEYRVYHSINEVNQAFIKFLSWASPVMFLHAFCLDLHLPTHFLYIVARMNLFSHVFPRSA